MNVNYLAFADPAAGGKVALPTFWHLGASEVPSTRLIPDIIRKSRDESKGEHVLFFGSSAGGFAALNYSAQFPGSGALVMNPRINVLHEPKRAPKYVPVAFPDAPLAAVIRSLPYNQARIYGKPRGNFVVYLQNRGDATYNRHHYAHFAKAVRGRTDMHFVMGDWGKGHVVPPREVFENLLMKLVASAPDWENAVVPLCFAEEGAEIVEMTPHVDVLSVSETFTRLGLALQDTEDPDKIAEAIADAESAIAKLRSLETPNR
ncbi:hypothetical protein [Glutamicibacter creatinolyticus]|uniref:hypothetical protein n=1 Tax=Glutamicibacter creatinolyticus TaxID=162496 RepID=UPI0037C0C9E7